MRIFNHPTIRLVFLGLLLVVRPISAKENEKPPKLFSDPSEWNVTLAGPWTTVQRNVRKDDRYPVHLTYPAADGSQRTIDAEVAARGITRRHDVCKFPPLKIYFDKEKLKGTEFRGNKSLKLVTYCHTSSKYEQYYVKEFLVYRVHNLITEYSFKVKPMIINYRNNEKDSKSLTRFGFLIEDLDDVAKRHDMVKLSVPRISSKSLDSLETSYFSLFQYMVGNLDWAAIGGPDPTRCCHNSRLIGKGDDEVPKYAIPYDFDSTGLVNAHYAAPPDALKVRSVRQRLYRGYCAHKATLPQAVAHFKEKKADILALFETNTHLTSKNKKNAIEYIEEFYQILDDPKVFKRDVTDKCRG